MAYDASSGKITFTGTVGTFETVTAELTIINAVNVAPRAQSRVKFKNTYVVKATAPRGQVKAAVALVSYTPLALLAASGRILLKGTVGTFQIPDLIYITARNTAPRAQSKVIIDNPIIARAKMGFGPLRMASTNVEVPFGAVGVMGFGPLSMKGEVFVPPFRVVGAMGFPGLELSSLIAVPPVINAHPGFGALSMKGEISIRQEFDGVIGFAGLQMTGLVALGSMSVRGKMMIPGLDFVGQVFVPEPPPVDNDGAVGNMPSFASNDDPFQLGGGAYFGSNGFTIG